MRTEAEACCHMHGVTCYRLEDRRSHVPTRPHGLSSDGHGVTGRRPDDRRPHGPNVPIPFTCRVFLLCWTVTRVPSQYCPHHPVRNMLRQPTLPDGRLEVSLHPEGPATDQLDQGFPWISLVPKQMLSSYPISTLLCSVCFTCSPPDGNFNICRPNAAH
jgi:hypothetical protein